MRGPSGSMRLARTSLVGGFYMYRQVLCSSLVVVLLSVACTPTTTSSVNPKTTGVTELSVVTEKQSTLGPPERLILYSPLTDYWILLEEMDRAARVVHPRFAVVAGQTAIKYDGDRQAWVYIEGISSGVSRVIVTALGHDEAVRVKPVLDAFASMGITVLTSGLPEIQPIPVPIMTVSSGGELFRYYSGAVRGELLAHARSCQTDYMVGPLGSGGINIDATDMHDGRVRLYVDVHDSNWEYARLQEVRHHVGLFLACLDSRVGPGE